MGAGKCVVKRSGITKVAENSLHGTKLFAVSRPQYESFRHLNRRNGDAVMLWKCNDIVITLYEALFDLFLRRGNNRMSETLAKEHAHQCDDLHRLSGAGRLFDQHVP